MAAGGCESLAGRGRAVQVMASPRRCGPRPHFFSGGDQSNTRSVSKAAVGQTGPVIVVVSRYCTLAGVRVPTYRAEANAESRAIPRMRLRLLTSNRIALGQHLATVRVVPAG